MGMESYLAEHIYGGSPAPQPASHPAGSNALRPGDTPEPMARTLPRVSASGLLANPMFALVAVLGVAFLLLHLSVRGSVSASVGK